LTDSIVTPTIFHLLADAKKEIGAVGKNDTNQIQKFKFRGIDAVVNAVAPVFNQLGVITVPEVLEHEYETVVIGAKQTQMGHVRLIVKYHFYGPDGDFVTATVASESMDSGDKATPKAMSVAFRTALLQVLNLPTDEPDPDSESYERSSAKSTPATASRAPRTPVKPWEQRVADAGTADELNALWLEAAAATGLTEDMKKLVYKRKDEIDLKSPSRQVVGAGAN
jgi:hypothetical protein